MSDPVIPYNAQYDAFANSQVPGWSYYNPWANAPGGAIGQQIIGMAGSAFMNQAGFQPMGIGYQGGLHNNMNQQMFSMAHMKSMEQASKADMSILMSTQRGMFAMAGRHVGQAEEQAMEQFNSYLIKAAPYMDPGLLDTLSGGRSATNLAHFTHLGGRFRRDAVTGYRGMSGDTSAHVAKGLQGTYFDEVNYGYKTAGLTSKDMGGMFDELSRRGMMAPTGTNRERVVAGLMHADYEGRSVQSILQASGVSAPGFAQGKESALSALSETDINKLLKNSDVQSGMRSVDTRRISDTLDKYKGSIAAIKEIFGENGKPNAPMRELMTALESLTQGGLQQLQPGRTEMVVRNMYNAAKMAGVDMATVSGMMQAAGQQTDAMGRNPIFASQMTTGGLLFGVAYQDAGLGANNAWGLQNQKQMMGSHMAAQGRGLNSEVANRMATLLRIRERVGGLSGRSEAIAKGLESGTMDGRLAEMGYGAFRDMLATDAGLSGSQIEQALQHKQQNEEFVYNNNLGATIARYAQPHEMNRLVLQKAGARQGHAFARKLIGTSNGELNDRLGVQMTASWRSMNATVLTDGKARTISAARDMYDYLERTSKNDPGSDEAKLYKKLSGMNEDERNKELRMYAENAWGDAEQTHMDKYGGAPLINDMLRQSTAAGQAQDKASAEVKLKSALDSRAKGVFSGGSPMFNFIRSMQEAGENPTEASLTAIFAKTLGGVNKQQFAGALASQLVVLDKAQDELQTLRTEGVRNASTISKEAADEIDRQVDEKAKAIEEQKNKIQSYMDQHGLTDVLGSMIDKGTDADGNQTAMTFTGANFVINAPEGTLTLKNAKGQAVAKNESRGGTPVATV